MSDATPDDVTTDADEFFELEPESELEPAPESAPEPDAAAATSAALRRVATSGNYRADTKKRAPSSKARSERRGPQPVGGALADLLADRGWSDHAAIAQLVGEWAEVVGPELADHVHLESFDEGTMVLRADSTAWATQLRLLLPQVRAALEARVGSGVIADISIAGPQAPSWKHGSRRVKGRGPRDTYG